MPRPIAMLLVCLLVGSMSLSTLQWAAPLRAAQPTISQQIFLRRGAFDPLTAPPSQPATRAATASGLLLVQLDHAPDEAARAQLQAAGLQPLLYIPENTFLVRSTAGGRAAQAAVPGVRWAGTLDPAAKLDAGLDAALQDGSSTRRLDLRVAATPDADAGALAAALVTLGATIVGTSQGENGVSLHVHLPGSALAAVRNRGDVIWIEPYIRPALTNDRAHEIVELGTLPERMWLDGSGQIVAVTDSGLDVQSKLSADFAGQLVEGFANRDIVDSRYYTNCTSADWSDRNGHGTHVAGAILGTGSLSGGVFAGIAPGARLIIQNASSGGNDLDCFPDDTSYLQLAYDAGARIQNGSFGAPTGGAGDSAFGGYTVETQDVDSYLWRHPDHVFVVAAGNAGLDSDQDGLIDRDSINTPGTAKNVITVGASENYRPPTDTPCVTFSPANLCWQSYGYQNSPNSLAKDPVSDNPNGLAAFSSRGPTDDGRIKPDIVAPGTNLISARSHYSTAHYSFTYDDNYAYNSGTSMATPIISGLAAITRQWLIELRGETRPGAALIRALLLNGATDIGPGQYVGVGLTEIGPQWPNNAEGWGRASFANSVDLTHDHRIWFAQGAGLHTNDTTEYQLVLDAGQPLSITLSWQDYPASPLTQRALVNNLDLEVVLPDGSTTRRGNEEAALDAVCRDSAGADVCNTTESLRIQAPLAGTYTVRVHAAVVNPLAQTQPYALVVRGSNIQDTALAAPQLQPIVVGSLASASLRWNAVASAAFYEVEASATDTFTQSTVIRTADTKLTLVQEGSSRFYRVRACVAGGCGAPGAASEAIIKAAARTVFLPIVLRSSP